MGSGIHSPQQVICADQKAGCSQGLQQSRDVKWMGGKQISSPGPTLNSASTVKSERTVPSVNTSCQSV